MEDVLVVEAIGCCRGALNKLDMNVGRQSTRLSEIGALNAMWDHGESRGPYGVHGWSWECNDRGLVGNKSSVEDKLG